ncbi:glycosyltransferase [Aliihoeflea sp. PC F10.4]
MRVMIVVTHLLGVGHLARAVALADAFTEAGHQTLLVTGGRPSALHRPTEDVEMVQLPPVHAVGTDFVNLRNETGHVASTQIFSERARLLVGAADDFQPDAILTETYPFGRKALREEFDALIEWSEKAGKRPLVFASIRDILNPPSSAAKAQRAEETIIEHYDGVLVHGDEGDAPLALSWPVSERLDAFLHYTGYVTRQREALSAGQEGGGILVSAGGGMAGLPLFRVAVAAASQMQERQWHILVGEGVAEAEMEQLVRNAPPNAKVERARADFPALLVRADLSISQAGYNTAADLAGAGTRAILVPFAEGGEQEQSLRAEGLAASGRASVLPADELTSEALCDMARSVLETPRPVARKSAQGASRTVTIVADACAARDRIDAAFAAFSRRLDELAHDGRTVDVWWRDDDAASDTLALHRLLQLRRDLGVPLALAASPGLVEPSLPALLQDEKDVYALVHGVSHLNNAPTGAKKQELGFVDLAVMLQNLQKGLETHLATFGPLGLPVLVPPWNRIDADIVGGLQAIGFTGLSTFGKRAALRHDGLAICNTHLDPVAWRQGKRLGDVAALLDKAHVLLTEQEPIGILTHHLIHDGATWRFLERLLGLLAGHSAVRFRAATDLWAPQFDPTSTAKGS